MRTTTSSGVWIKGGWVILLRSFVPIASRATADGEDTFFKGKGLVYAAEYDRDYTNRDGRREY